MRCCSNANNEHLAEPNEYVMPSVLPQNLRNVTLDIIHENGETVASSSSFQTAAAAATTSSAVPVYATVNKDRKDQRNQRNVRSSADGQCYANLPAGQQSAQVATQQVSNRVPNTRTTFIFTITFFGIYRPI